MRISKPRFIGFHFAFGGTDFYLWCREYWARALTWNQFDWKMKEFQKTCVFDLLPIFSWEQSLDWHALQYFWLHASMHRDTDLWYWWLELILVLKWKLWLWRGLTQISNQDVKEQFNSWIFFLGKQFLWYGKYVFALQKSPRPNTFMSSAWLYVFGRIMQNWGKHSQSTENIAPHYLYKSYRGRFGQFRLASDWPVEVVTEP